MFGLRFSRVVLFAVFTTSAVFLLAGCGVYTTPTVTSDEDFRTCENILRAWYQALSAENFPLALSYCKTGGITFDYTNNLWRLSIEYPHTDILYVVRDVYQKEYLNPNMISMRYDFCEYWYFYGSYYDTQCKNYFLMLFERVNGEWKLA